MIVYLFNFSFYLGHHTLSLTNITVDFFSGLGGFLHVLKSLLKSAKSGCTWYLVQKVILQLLYSSSLLVLQHLCQYSFVVL